MKKLTLLTLAVVSIATASYAQISKGSVLLGGGISGSQSDSESESGTYKNEGSSFGFYPTIGVAIKDNAVVGMRLSYSTSHSDQTSPGNLYKQNQKVYSAGVFYRRYLPLSRVFYLFGEGAFYYAAQESNNESVMASQKYTQTSNGVGVNLYPGVAYAVGKRFHLEIGLNNLLSLDYSNNKSESINQGQSSTNTKGSSFNFSTNLSSSAPLTVGFRFVLGK